LADRDEWCAIPDHQQLAGQVPQQMAKELRRIGTAEGVVLHVQQQPVCQSADNRQMLVGDGKAQRRGCPRGARLRTTAGNNAKPDWTLLNPWLGNVLIEAAAAAGKTKDTYLAAQYRHLVRRRGRNKAAVAVSHSVLVIVWHLLRHYCLYVDLGSTYFDDRDRVATECLSFQWVTDGYRASQWSHSSETAR
jgi:hypothetical protein